MCLYSNSWLSFGLLESVFIMNVQHTLSCNCNPSGNYLFCQVSWLGRLMMNVKGSLHHTATGINYSVSLTSFHIFLLFELLKDNLLGVVNQMDQNRENNIIYGANDIRIGLRQKGRSLASETGYDRWNTCNCGHHFKKQWKIQMLRRTWNLSALYPVGFLWREISARQT